MSLPANAGKQETLSVRMSFTDPNGISKLRITCKSTGCQISQTEHLSFTSESQYSPQREQIDISLRLSDSTTTVRRWRVTCFDRRLFQSEQISTLTNLTVQQSYYLPPVSILKPGGDQQRWITIHRQRTQTVGDYRL